MNSKLYLLVAAQRTAFKIGITDDIKSRYMRLSSLWGELDLDASCMVFGDRREVAGLEKTLHFLLERWRIRNYPTIEGHSEWFSMECFDKAIDIIHSAAMLRGLVMKNTVVYGIDIAARKETNKEICKKEPRRTLFCTLDDLKIQLADYRESTIDFRNSGKSENMWSWTIDIRKCRIHPFDSMLFKEGNTIISLVGGVSNLIDAPSIVTANISKSALSFMKNYESLKFHYECVCSEIDTLTFRYKQNFIDATSLV